jgi:HEXXH motif-containing protein
VPNPNPAARRIAPPRDLTIPESGSVTARGVLSGAITRLVSELPTVGRGFVPSPELRTDLARFHVLCRELAGKHPGALPSLLRRTPIATLVRCLRHQPTEALASELIGLVYFELSRVGALDAPLQQHRPPRRLVSMGGRLVITMPESARVIVYANGVITVKSPGDATELRLDELAEKPAGFRADHGGVLVEKPYHDLEGDLVLALADNNPLSMFEAHPDKQGNAIDLGGKTVEDWTGVLRDALQLIESMLPDLRREMDLFVQQIVPVGYDEEKHLSASYQEAIGTIYMSLHPSLMTMTEALIHEFSHNKINAFFELDEVLENAFSPLYASPVRPDPRPLHGVLLAVHAFLPVARLYERMIESGHPLAQNPSFVARFAKVRQINAEGADVVLGNGRPTAMGKPLMEEIRRWHEHYGKYGQ